VDDEIELNATFSDESDVWDASTWKRDKKKPM
jgi:hypothetical protein